ncbi:unnamed protein product [Dicrocoelium dendriticum]|nr:unnamed protein product [Dicrocoelium dendriticum]
MGEFIHTGFPILQIILGFHCDTKCYSWKEKFVEIAHYGSGQLSPLSSGYANNVFLGSELASRAISSSVAVYRWLHNSLHNVRWPSNRGRELVKCLCMQLRFDTRSATILRNCTTTLDLRYYRLVSDDLLICLTACWSFLTELKLNGHHHGQLSVTTVTGIHYIGNLRSLFLD